MVAPDAVAVTGDAAVESADASALARFESVEPILLLQHVKQLRA
jgi:hypothetical protein